MSMLPDVDQTGYDDWQNQLFEEDAKSKIQGIAFNQQANDQMASLARIGAWASTPAPELPTPEPQPEPAPEPAAAPEVVSAAPAPAPVAPASRGAASPPSSLPQSAPAPAAPTDWASRAFNAAVSAGADAGQFISGWGSETGDRMLDAMNAVISAGGDVDRFLQNIRPGGGAAAAPFQGVAPGPTGPPGSFQDYARQAALKAGVDPDIFTRQIQQESGFNPNARSPAGATGIAQFMPGTAKGMGIDPTDPHQSLDAGARLMRQNLDKYGGDYAKALAAYNAGPGNVDKYGGVPPFEETQRYIRTILGSERPTAAQGLERVGARIASANQVDPSGHTFPLIGYKVGSSGNNDPHSTYHSAGGSDLMAPRGTPVVAMNGGTVVELMTEDPNRPGSTIGGNALVVRGDDGLDYYYAHLDGAPQLKRGDRVGSGQVLGAVGNTGNAWKGGKGETHLHIGIGHGISTGQGAEGGLGQNFDAKGFLSGLLGTSADAPGDFPRMSSPHAPDQEANPIAWLADQKQAMLDSFKPPKTAEPEVSIVSPQRSSVFSDTSNLFGEPTQQAASITPAQPLEVAGVQAAAEPEPQPQSPVDKLKNAFGDFIDSLSGGQQPATTEPLQPITRAEDLAQDQAVSPIPAPGRGYDPSALRAITEPPQEGIPLRQDVRDIAQESQSTIFDELSKPRLTGLREDIANAPVLGGALDLARGPALISDEELLQRARPGELERAREWIDLQNQIFKRPPHEPTRDELVDALRTFQYGEAAALAEAGTETGAARTAGRVTRAIDYEALANLRRGQRAAQPGLLDMPAAEASLVDRALAFGVNNMLSNPASLVANGLSGGLETVKRPVVTALSGELGSAGADLRAMGLAVGDALADAAGTFSTGRRASATGEQVEAFGGWGGVIATPFLRTMAATDEFLRSINAAGAQAAEFARIKRAYPDLTQTEIIDRFAERILGAGTHAAGQAVFETGGTGIGRSLASARAQLTAPGATFGERVKGGAAQVLVPFSVIPDVILSRGVRNLPIVNEVAGTIEGYRALRAGDPQAARRTATSSVLAEATNAAIWSQVLAGNVTGSGPQDEAKKRALMNARDQNGDPLWRPNSIRVGGQWIPYSSFGPVALQIGFVANAVEQYEETGRQVNPNYMKAFGLALGDTITDAWYLQTLSGLFGAVKNGTLPDWMGQQALATAGRAVPEAALLNVFRGLTDPVQREGRPKLDNPDTWLDYFANKIPVASQLVPPKIDPATGRPMEEPKNLGSAVFRATAPGEPNRVNEVLARHNLGVGDAPDTITPSKGLTIAINQDEQRQFLELSGPEVEKLILAVSDKPSFYRAPPDVQREILQGLISDGREIAAAKLTQTLPREEIVRRMQAYDAAQKAQAQPAVRLP